VTAVALAISIAIDPLVITRPEPTEPPAPAPPAPPAEPVAAPPPAAAEASESAPKTAETREREIAFRAEAGVGGSIASGAAPSTAFGLLGFFEVRRDIFSLGVDLRADLPASRAVAGGGRVQSSLVLASLAPCLHLSIPRDAPLFLCALASAGQLSGSADGLAHPSSASAFFAAFGGRLGVDVPLGDTFFLRAHGDLLVAATRHVLTVDDAPAFTVPPVAAVLGLAAAARF